MDVEHVISANRAKNELGFDTMKTLMAFRYRVAILALLCLASILVYVIVNVLTFLGDSTTSARTVIQSGHTDKVIALAFSQDQRILASGSLDRTIRLWEASGGNLLRVLRGPIDTVRTIAFAQKGCVLIAAGEQGTVKVWDLKSGKLLRSWNVYISGRKTARSFSYAFSNDGRFLASGSVGGNICVWDTKSGSLKKSFASDIIQGGGLLGHNIDITVLAFSPSGDRIVSGDRDGGIFIWSLTKRRSLFEPKPRGPQPRDVPQIAIREHEAPIASIDFSTDGKHFCVFDMDKLLTVFSQDGSVVSQRRFDPNRTPGLAYYYGDRIILTNCKSGFELLHGEQLNQINILASDLPVYCAAFPETREKVAVGLGSRVCIWDITADEPIWLSPPSLMSLKSITILRPGNKLAAMYEKGVAIWSLTELAQIQWHSLGEQTTTLCVVDTDDGPKLLSEKKTDKKNSIRLHPLLPSRLNKMENILQFTIEESIEPILFSNRFLMTPSLSGSEVKIWDLRKSPPTALSFRVPEERKIIAVGPDGKLFCVREPEIIDTSVELGVVFRKGRVFLVHMRDNLEEILDPVSGLVLASEFPSRKENPLYWMDSMGCTLCRGGSPQGPTQIALFSPDKLQMAWACQCLENSHVGHDRFSGSDLFGPTDNGLQIWDTTTGKLICRLVDKGIERYGLSLITTSAHAGGTLGVDFSSDCKMIASCGYDRDAKLWSLPAGRLVRRFDTAHDKLQEIYFAQDDSFLVTRSEDHIIHVWDIPSGKETILAIFRDGRWISVGWHGILHSSKSERSSGNVTIQCDPLATREE